MLSRREWLNLTLGTGVALTLEQSWLQAQQPLITRAIPSSGEKIPVVGLGSSATFSSVARSEDVTALRDVLKAFTDQGGTVFDTAPSYGASEDVAGRLGGELGITDKIFWATKVNVAPRGGGNADPAAAKAQIDASFAKLKKAKVDLIQVHNLGDIPTQLGILKEQKKAGRVRYIGVTSTNKGQYADLQAAMRNEPLDFIGVDYAIDNRDVEATILPLAQERKIGVLVYVPFGRTRLFKRVGDRPVPDWATQVGAATWGAVLPEVRHRAPRRDLRHARDQPGQERDRQPRRRPRQPSRRGHAQEDGRVHRGPPRRIGDKGRIRTEDRGRRNVLPPSSLLDPPSCHFRCLPPSTRTTWPVTQSCSSRPSTAWAMTSGPPQWPRGVAAITAACIASVEPDAGRMGPGAIALT